MVAADKKREATYADVLAAPPHMVAEIIRGNLVLTPRPAPAHASAAAEIVTDLGGAFGRGRGGPGGWRFLFEPELHLEGREKPIVPDIAGWRRTRMPSLPKESFIALAPDWVCEILSPATEALDRSDKMDVYGEAGVGHAWLVDPTLRTLEVFRLDGKEWRMVKTWRDTARVRAEPFDAIELDLSVFWTP